jgi:para-aminobenzoate synthetase component I
MASPTLTALPFSDPFAWIERLRGEQHVSFLDSAKGGAWSYIGFDLAMLFQVKEGKIFIDGKASEGEPLPVFRRLLAQNRCEPVEEGPPFQNGVMGYLSYEAAHLFENLPHVQRFQESWPQMEFAVYRQILAFDHEHKTCFLIAHSDARNWDDFINAPSTATSLAKSPSLIWQGTETRQSFEDKVQRIQDYIRAGDFFQANLSQRFEASEACDPVLLYAQLRAANPAPFCAFFKNGNRFIASTSPEQFLKINKGQITTCPIKGTRKRESDPHADAAIARELLTSEKDRAENIMIVDLLRNDLSRIAKPFSVAVPKLCALESFASVHHLVSTVTAELKESFDALDALAACFPGGSVTGAPKIRAMEVIAELEGEARGVYCGALGWISTRGDAEFSIPIRTLTGIDDRVTLRSGGGVTLLSSPQDEYQETLTKAERMIRATGSLA